MQTRLWITLPNSVHDSYGLEILSEDEELVKRFYEICMNRIMYSDIGRRLGTFFQGGHDDKTWKYFEFLTGSIHGEVILNLAMEIAEELGLELEIGE